MCCSLWNRGFIFFLQTGKSFFEGDWQSNSRRNDLDLSFECLECILSLMDFFSESSHESLNSLTNLGLEDLSELLGRSVDICEDCSLETDQVCGDSCLSGDVVCVNGLADFVFYGGVETRDCSGDVGKECACESARSCLDIGLQDGLEVCDFGLDSGVVAADGSCHIIAKRCVEG